MIIRASTTAFVVILLAGSVAADDPYLDAARGVAHWVSASAVPTNDGLVWPAGPRDPKSIDTTLYTGTPGPILFLLELSRDTDDSAALTSARAGADALLASLSEEKGIYTITHDDAYLERFETELGPVRIAHARRHVDEEDGLAEAQHVFHGHGRPVADQHVGVEQGLGVLHPVDVTEPGMLSETVA